MKLKHLALIFVILVVIGGLAYNLKQKRASISPLLFNTFGSIILKAQGSNLTPQQAVTLAAQAKAIGDDIQQNSLEFYNGESPEEALAKNPNDIVAIRTMATKYSKRRDYQSALMWEDKGLKIKLNDQGLRFKKADTLFHLNRDKEGIALLEGLAIESGDSATLARMRLNKLKSNARYQPYLVKIDPKLLQP